MTRTNSRISLKAKFYWSVFEKLIVSIKNKFSPIKIFEQLFIMVFIVTKSSYKNPSYASDLIVPQRQL